MALDDARLLDFAQKLQSATEVSELLQISAAELRDVIGYQTAWIAVFESDTDSVRMLAVDGDNDADVWSNAPVFPLSADPYMVRILSSTKPQVVIDAQEDPDVNRAIVEALGNRTIVNVPMWLMDQPFGALGTGSFGDQGVLVPTPEQLAYLTAMANQLVIASARIVLLRQREEAAAEARKMQAMLEKKGRLASLGQLAGGVAHDFNNLLTVIMASADLLREDEPDAQRRDELTNILDASERAAELTRHLLALGKRQPLSLTQFQPRSMLTSLTNMLRRVVPADIEIEVFVSEKVPRMAADRPQLEQVITNLCLNARDAMSEGGVLTISADAVELDAGDLSDWPSCKPGPYLEVVVRDTGVGMSPEIQERIFEPFYTTKGVDQGTGLGLAVCRSIVERHNGLIHVDSEDGKGATFRVCLPVGTAPAIAAVADPPEAVRGGHERILVADDQPHVRRAIQQMLGRVGYSVTAVVDGQAAVEAATAEAFDLVILDAVMPKMGGRGAFERIRAAQPNTRFVFASGYGAEAITARFLSDTQVPLVHKPFAPEILLGMVRRVLDSPIV